MLCIDGTNYNIYLQIGADAHTGHSVTCLVDRYQYVNIPHTFTSEECSDTTDSSFPADLPYAYMHLEGSKDTSIAA